MYTVGFFALPALQLEELERSGSENIFVVTATGVMWCILWYAGMGNSLHPIDLVGVPLATIGTRLPEFSDLHPALVHRTDSLFGTHASVWFHRSRRLRSVVLVCLLPPSNRGRTVSVNTNSLDVDVVWEIQDKKC